LIFYDLNRTNLQDQSPIFLTVQNRNTDMLKFLMSNKCSITMKEGKGDTIKEHILRYGTSAPGNSDSSMIDVYMKYEDKMIIEKIVEPIVIQGLNKNSYEKSLKNAKSYFRWNSPRFIKLFMKLVYTNLMRS
jgi:hypothetical protein